MRVIRFTFKVCFTLVVLSCASSCGVPGDISLTTPWNDPPPASFPPPSTFVLPEATPVPDGTPRIMSFAHGPGAAGN